MILCKVDEAGRILTMSYSQHIGAEEMRRCLGTVRDLMEAFQPGFLLLTDLSNLESMEASRAPELGAIMDLCSAKGMLSVVAARLLRRENDPALRLIICHLGGGCSLAATIGGKSVDTTMGFTPLDGIAMCTRSGALDPGILLFLMRENPDVDQLEKTLDRASGLQGLSGLPGDTRILVPEAGKGNLRAKLAMDVFIHRLQAGIGQMMAPLGGRPNAIVFTDAIGEDEPLV